MIVLFILIQVIEGCSFFKNKKPPEYYVIQRNQFRKKGFVYECNDFGIKLINTKYEEFANDIELDCLEKNIVHRFHIKDLKKEVTTSTDKDGTISYKPQVDYDNEFLNDNRYNFEPGKRPFWYGSMISWYKSNRITHLTCFGLYEKDVNNNECLQMEFDTDGNVTKREQNDFFSNCQPYHCAEIIPFLPEGKYVVIFDELKVFEKPSKESNVLFTLDGKEKVDVIEDTHVFTEINHDVAPFVKIKTEKGKEGFVFGAGIAEIR
jgi:hypothetical protein